VASRWDALLPDPRRQKLASPKHRFDQVVHTDGVAISIPVYTDRVALTVNCLTGPPTALAGAP
ncbi:hypothetical protein HaLaN_02103, partial [Haematococcus lacustris]